jgi:predicted ester cyclase
MAAVEAMACRASTSRVVWQTYHAIRDVPVSFLETFRVEKGLDVTRLPSESCDLSTGCLRGAEMSLGRFIGPVLAVELSHARSPPPHAGDLRAPIIGTPTAVATGRRHMVERDNVRIARQSWDAWNARDIEGVLKTLDEKPVWETDTLPAPVVGREGYRQAMRMYITAFPDLHFAIDQLLPSGDYVVSQYTATGTHNGDLMGIRQRSVRLRSMAAPSWRFGTVR